MSPHLFSDLAGRWRRRRERREAAALDWIKSRYHIFRVLLANNESALAAMAEVDGLVNEHETTRLTETVRTLLEMAMDLVDGLNRLTENAHLGLYPRIENLGRRLEKALESYGRAPRRVWLPLEDVTADMREQAGGKAQPLGGLLRAGLPVPAGVCITRRACREYLRQARLEDRLKALLRQAALPGADIGEVSSRAKAMVLASEPTPEFAAQLHAAWEHLCRDWPHGMSARSSASSEDGREHSFAGQFASVLGVSSPEALVGAFKTVLASAFAARALAYRIGAGLASESLDMAVLCQRMIAARSSGVLFTRDPMDPDGGRMLLTAVPGLGTQAVSGRAVADVYRPARELGTEPTRDTPVEIAEKTVREVLAPRGGLRLEDVPEDMRHAALLAPGQIEALRGHGLRIEALAGCPQDIEWSVDEDGRVWILQARPARLVPTASGRAAGPSSGDAERVLLAGGVGASPGRAAGCLFTARSRSDLDAAARAQRPIVLALHQSLVDAASLVPEVAAVLVDMGNPLDHLAALSRELGIPMITGLGTATTALQHGEWVLADADRGLVLAADPRLWRDISRPASRTPSRPVDAAANLRRMILPLNLTDAYGPTFSIQEIKSLHDVVRYVHEKAVIALFETGDAVAEQTFSLVRRLRDGAGLSFLIIDLGGGLVPGRSATVGSEDILCEPLAALCRGMATPGLRWGKPPPIPGVSGLISRSMLDGRSERPVGNPNYALAARDYLNVNARVDYHFAMIDAVCGANPRENSIRFRFKGGGTARVQRERRARFVEEVLREEEFYTTRQGDMVTAALVEGSRETVQDKMEMLGRFLGFSRLLDAVMIDDDMPGRVARAFRAGDYSLDGLAGIAPGNGP
ncbi:pyruvate, phosphate dikinase [Desulfovibrio sulfodismutans]|uniref:Phosphoenolpyruvate synthase n=1 Tax=Desulfolutivibrio sulfodismutans TaxID=63561 RepID=A0A7K3NI28_9BACT|nr:PEP/pyruvate-binding domain-containing protein [Desulfolutivibrio sulfodismutans]NDY55445.1 pyruvate, phosphate dikinase [Desulfolutivibrio sulfodismutans]QLA12184.1 pyruvate, phosphate dikinase [Desulfolutivibrio sulfodismutans DSM 3696]